MISINNNPISLPTFRGVVHQRQLNFTSAISCYRRAIGLRPQLAVAYLNLGTSLVSLADHRQEAISVLRMGARLDGHGVRDRGAHEEARYTCYLQLSGLLRSEGNLQEAASLLKEALEALPRCLKSREQCCICVLGKSMRRCSIGTMPSCSRDWPWNCSRSREQPMSASARRWPGM